MASLPDILKKIRKEKKLKQKDIAQLLRISESAYGYYEQGKNEPPINTLRKLAEYYDVTVSYLLGLSEDPDQLSLVVDSTFKDEHVDLNKKPADYFGDSKSEDIRPILDTLLVPFVSSIDPNYLKKDIIHYLTINNIYKLEKNEVFATIAPDNSMSGDRILKGDKIVVSISENKLRNGDIALVSLDNTATTMRRVKKTRTSQIILYSSNSKYVPYLYDSENIIVLGKIIQVIIDI